jgi:hypothetical protein
MGVVGASPHLDSNSFHTYHMKPQSCGGVAQHTILSADNLEPLQCAGSQPVSIYGSQITSR